MSPHLDNLSTGHGRLFPGQHVNGDDDDDHYGGNYAGQNHMAAPLGEFLAAGSVVNLFFGFLIE
jgi:hypothetical protein